MPIKIGDNELASIASLEEELRDAQALDLRIESENGLIQRTIDNAAVKASIYSNPKKLQSLITELSAVVFQFQKQSGNKGRLLGRKAMDNFLDESERRTRTDKALRIIGQANERSAARRLDVYTAQLQKEFSVLKNDIKIFKLNARSAGFTKKEMLAQLVRSANDKAGIVQGFAKRVKKTADAVVRRERSAREIDEFKKSALPGEEWVWVTVSSKPCPDCEARAGAQLTIDRWQQLGVPGSGRTICRQYCMCKLMPSSIAEKRFPTVRVFDYNKGDGVLTTASEERTLRAKSNKYDGKTTVVKEK